MRFTKPLSIQELKKLFTEGLLNKTSKVTKVSDSSVLNGVAYGVAKIGQKAMKDVALLESFLLVDSASGSQLDTIAAQVGVSERFGALASSTYLRLVGDVGTTYTPGVHVVSGSDGLQFQFTSEVVIGDNGFAYGEVRCTSTGERTNVNPLTLTDISPTPSGHSYLINEVRPINGRDSESDDTYRKRIKEGANLAATGTISKLEQVFMKINPLVLRVFHLGTNDVGKTILGIATQTGTDLTALELSDLLVQAAEYLNLNELQNYSYDSIGVTLQNIDYEYIDMDFRAELEEGYDSEEVRKEIQIRVTKYMDFRFWDYTKQVEWDDLLEVAKNTKGIKYVSDNNFYPSTDTTVPYTKLPRLRSFILRDLDGNIMTNVSGTLSPVFYGSDPSASYQQTILATID